MARTRKALPARVDVAHLISVGVLASVCPRSLIEEVLAQTGKASQRERLLLAPAVVYYVMALALWCEAPLKEVCGWCAKACSGSAAARLMRCKPASKQSPRHAPDSVHK
jgi:hypothetical protein